MNLEHLTHTSGEWLRGRGPESDIVISSRIRLARNLAAFPFTNRASGYQKAEIETLLRDRISKMELDPRLGYVQVPGLSQLDRQLLVERQLISRELAAAEGPRGVALGPQETVSLMVNEEDHLRLQVMRSGFALDEAWQEIDRIDDLLEQKVTYAFSEEFGYLTACPTNVGTGMRASVMMHLPALEFTRQIEKVYRALQKINLAVRGLYGEGSRPTGHFYQISNQVTLGKSETQILSEIQSVIPQIISYERISRESWLRENRQSLEDRVTHAYDTLRSATLMTSEETMELLSYVRLGINLHLVDDISIPTVNELFIHTQPAHLQKLMGESLDGEAQNAARARYLRTRLREAQGASQLREAMPHIEFVVESANVRPDRVILTGRSGASSLAVGDRFTAVEYRYPTIDEKTGREQLGPVDEVRAVSLEIEEILAGSSLVERLPDRTQGVIRCGGSGMECFEVGMPLFVRVLVGEKGADATKEV